MPRSSRVSLAKLHPSAHKQPSHARTLLPAAHQGMETQQPCLRLPDGSRLVGAFEETVGAQLLLADTLGPDGSHRVELVGHTDKRITFSRPQQEAEGPDAELAEVGEAAAAAAAAAAPP